MEYVFMGGRSVGKTLRMKEMINNQTINIENFKRKYCQNSRIDEKTFDEHFVILPCNCDYDGCEGLAAVNKIPLSIKIHNEMYSERIYKKGSGKL